MATTKTKIRRDVLRNLDDSPIDLSAGASMLLKDCVGGRLGERLLIVEEPTGSGFYDDEAPALTAAVARLLGMIVYMTEVDSFVATPEDVSALTDVLRGFDHVVFFSRVGDQIRFSCSDELPPATMCYTLTKDSLNSAFGTACYHGLCEIKVAIDDAFFSATEIRVTCPGGTDYSGCPAMDLDAAGEVGLKRFPMLVARPIPAAGFTGRVALSRFLLGTGSRNYEPYYLPLADTVFACVEDNRIIDFEGASETVERVRLHYRHVSEQFEIDPWFVHSWHAGMHPGCYFNHNAEEDILRWSGTAFGSPRLLHFHTCGSYAPGEISWNIIDPTIYLDGVAIWEEGRFYPERLPNARGLLENHPKLVALYNEPPRDIGLSA